MRGDSNGQGGPQWPVWTECKRDIVYFHCNETGIQETPTHAAELHLASRRGNGSGAPFRVLSRINAPENEWASTM